MEVLVVFDFDSTLFQTPLPENGKSAWSEYYKMEFPYKGWWQYKESLDLSVFDISPNDWVYKQYIESESMGYTNILLTGRLDTLEKEVNDIIDKHSIKMDSVNLSNGDTLKFKLNFLYKIIMDNKDTLEKVIIYDDREAHQIHFMELSESIKSLLNIEVMVDFIIDGVGKLEI